MEEKFINKIDTNDFLLLSNCWALINWRIEWLIAKKDEKPEISMEEAICDLKLDELYNARGDVRKAIVSKLNEEYTEVNE